jgi:hypothetical protein
VQQYDELFTLPGGIAWRYFENIEFTPGVGR